MVGNLKERKNAKKEEGKGSREGRKETKEPKKNRSFILAEYLLRN